MVFAKRAIISQGMKHSKGLYELPNGGYIETNHGISIIPELIHAGPAIFTNRNLCGWGGNY